MGAMDYEYLLRRVYHCGRNSSKGGADADIYRKLERADEYLTNVSRRKTKEEKEFDYRKTFAEVRLNVLNAIREGLNQIKYRASKREVTELEEMESALHKPTFYDKKALDEFIDKADEIYRKYGLEMR